VAVKKNITLPTTQAPEFRGTVYPVRGREYFIGSQSVGPLTIKIYLFIFLTQVKYFSYHQKNVKDASITCMERNESLVTFDSYDEIESLSDIFQSTIPTSQLAKRV
jgi:hypothetical protein